ncbi:MAG: hypothetical protein IK023_01315, partial [Bacteroidaceae bacterium]|nr:hypothetical protein [Bacteroidaceae bacterium]
EIYESEDTSDTFTIGEDGKVTAVKGIAAEKAAKAKGIFTVDGKKVSAPQKGQIYVKDGKTVKF